MKLQVEDKIRLYQLSQQGQTPAQLSTQFGIIESNVRYLIKLIDKHGLNVISREYNRSYPPKLKQEIIDQVLVKGHSREQVSVDYALPSRGMLPNWISQYHRNGQTIVEKKRGRPVKTA